MVMAIISAIFGTILTLIGPRQIIRINRFNYKWNNDGN